MAKQTFKRWAKNLVAMAIQGGAASASATFGLAGANSLGVPVTPLDIKQFFAVFLAGAIAKSIDYLKTTPPPGFTEETIVIEKKTTTTSTTTPTPPDPPTT